MKNTHSKRQAGLITTLLPLQGVRREEKQRPEMETLSGDFIYGPACGHTLHSISGIFSFINKYKIGQKVHFVLSIKWP